jgi:hypothetical protein
VSESGTLSCRATLEPSRLLRARANDQHLRSIDTLAATDLLPPALRTSGHASRSNDQSARSPRPPAGALRDGPSDGLHLHGTRVVWRVQHAKMMLPAYAEVAVEWPQPRAPKLSLRLLRIAEGQTRGEAYCLTSRTRSLPPS